MGWGPFGHVCMYMHVRTYTCVHKRQVRMQRTTPDTIVVPPKAGSWEKACTHEHKCTQTHHNHTHNTQHATYTVGTPARRALVPDSVQCFGTHKTHTQTHTCTPAHMYMYIYARTHMRQDWFDVGFNRLRHRPNTHKSLRPAHTGQGRSRGT